MLLCMPWECAICLFSAVFERAHALNGARDNTNPDPHARVLFVPEGHFISRAMAH